MEHTDAETDRKTSSLSRTFWKPLTQLCRWSWCLYIMCICTLTSHSTLTACPCAVDLCTRPFALENCVWLPVSLEALAFDSQTVDTDHQGALLTLLVPKCCPGSCQHICSSEITLCQLNTRHRRIFQSFIAWCVILLEISKWVLEICTNVHAPPFSPPPPSITHLTNFSVVFIVSWHKRCVKHKS